MLSQQLDLATAELKKHKEQVDRLSDDLQDAKVCFSSPSSPLPPLCDVCGNLRPVLSRLMPSSTLLAFFVWEFPDLFLGAILVNFISFFSGGCRALLPPR